tara:strand:- start:3 stop:353 length:351 start_codon:yes stop_codon:yes gene_type:complete
MRKNKKRTDPRYFLSEMVEPAPVPLSSGPEEIRRDVYKYAKEDAGRDFFGDKEGNHEQISAAMPGSNVIDPMNHAHVSNATQSRDPNTIIPLGSDATHVYFKTADDIYMRIPRGAM